MESSDWSPIVSIRVEAPITEELLKPRSYTVDGRTIEVHRVVGDPPSEEARSASYRYNGVRLDNLEGEYRPGSHILTKQHTELVGAMNVLARAKFRNAELWPLPEPAPDLKAIVDGNLVYIEVTQIRPNDEAAFQREMQAASDVCNDFVSRDVVAQRLGGKQIRLAFVNAPIRRDHAKFAQALLDELRASDLTNPGRRELTDPYLTKYLHSFEIVNDEATYVRGAGIVNLRGFPDYAATALNKLHEKRTKAYTLDPPAPLWLAATITYGLGPDWLDALKSTDIPLGHFERIYICGLNDMLIYT